MLKSAFLLVALCFALASCVNDEWAKVKARWPGTAITSSIGQR